MVPHLYKVEVAPICHNSSHSDTKPMLSSRIFENLYLLWNGCSQKSVHFGMLRNFFFPRNCYHLTGFIFLLSWKIFWHFLNNFEHIFETIFFFQIPSWKKIYKFSQFFPSHFVKFVIFSLLLIKPIQKSVHFSLNAKNSVFI